MKEEEKYKKRHRLRMQDPLEDWPDRLKLPEDDYDKATDPYYARAMIGLWICSFMLLVLSVTWTSPAAYLALVAGIITWMFPSSYILRASRKNFALWTVISLMVTLLLVVTSIGLSARFGLMTFAILGILTIVDTHASISKRS